MSPAARCVALRSAILIRSNEAAQIQLDARSLDIQSRAACDQPTATTARAPSWFAFHYRSQRPSNAISGFLEAFDAAKVLAHHDPRLAEAAATAADTLSSVGKMRGPYLEKAARVNRRR
jgi:hypothetical protein